MTKNKQYVRHKETQRVKSSPDNSPLKDVIHWGQEEGSRRKSTGGKKRLFKNAPQ